MSLGKHGPPKNYNERKSHAKTGGEEYSIKQYNSQLIKKLANSEMYLDYISNTN